MNPDSPLFHEPRLIAFTLNRRPYDIVTTAGGWRVGLLGFLLDEPTAFRDKTFKGHEIEPVVQTAVELVRLEASIPFSIAQIIPMHWFCRRNFYS